MEAGQRFIGPFRCFGLLTWRFNHLFPYSVCLYFGARYKLAACSSYFFFFSSDRVAGTFSTWLLGLTWLLIVSSVRLKGINIVNPVVMPKTRRADTQHSVLPDECFLFTFVSSILSSHFLFVLLNLPTFACTHANIT